MLRLTMAETLFYLRLDCLPVADHAHHDGALTAARVAFQMEDLLPVT